MANPSDYLAAGSVPEKFVVKDPSHMRMGEVNSLWAYWEKRSRKKETLVAFLKAREGDIAGSWLRKGNQVPKPRSKQTKEYVEVDSDEDTDTSDSGNESELSVDPRPAAAYPKDSSPASVQVKDCMTFLRSLSADANYVRLLELLKDFPKFVKGGVRSHSFETFQWMLIKVS